MNIKESLTECNGKSITIKTKITSTFGHATEQLKGRDQAGGHSTRQLSAIAQWQ